MNKKWVELFEKVIGRKPTPEEFIAGRDSGFDFKAIKSIAGVAIDQVASESVSFRRTGASRSGCKSSSNLLGKSASSPSMDVHRFQKRLNLLEARTLKFVEAPAPMIDLEETNQTTQVFAPVESPSETAENLSQPVEAPGASRKHQS